MTSHIVGDANRVAKLMFFLSATADLIAASRVAVLL
jgi:hypothetical protein